MSQLSMLRDNLPFMVALSPVIGLFSVAAARRWSTALVRPMALTNAAVTFVLTCLVVLNYDSQRLDQRGRIVVSQMETRLNWLAETPSSVTKIEPTGFHVRLTFGVNGLTIWPLVWISMATWIAIWFPCARSHNSPAAYCIGLLAAESALLASWTSQDTIAGLLFFQASLPVFGFLIGRFGHEERSIAAVRFVNYLFIGSAILLLGSTLIIISVPWMKYDIASRPHHLAFGISELVDGIQFLLTRNELAIQIWDDISPWAFWLLVIGFAICLPVFPVSGIYGQTLTAAPAGVAGLFSIALPQLALCGWIRLTQPLFELELTAASMMIGTLACLSAMCYALIALSQRELKSFAITTSNCWLSLALLGARLPARESLVGALLLAQTQGLSLMAMLLLGEMLKQRFGDDKTDTTRGLIQTSPRLAALVAVVMATSLVGCFGAAPGSFLVISSASTQSLILAVWGVVAVFLLIGASVILAHKLLFGTAGHAARIDSVRGLSTTTLSSSVDSRHSVRLQESEKGADLTVGEFIGLAPLLTVLALFMVTPGFIIQRVEPTLARILERIERRNAPASEGENPSTSSELK